MYTTEDVAQVPSIRSEIDQYSSISEFYSVVPGPEKMQSPSLDMLMKTPEWFSNAIGCGGLTPSTRKMIESGSFQPLSDEMLLLNGLGNAATPTASGMSPSFLVYSFYEQTPGGVSRNSVGIIPTFQSASCPGAPTPYSSPAGSPQADACDQIERMSISPPGPSSSIRGIRRKRRPQPLGHSNGHSKDDRDIEQTTMAPRQVERASSAGKNSTSGKKIDVVTLVEKLAMSSESDHSSSASDDSAAAAMAVLGGGIRTRPSETMGVDDRVLAIFGEEALRLDRDNFKAWRLNTELPVLTSSEQAALKRIRRRLLGRTYAKRSRDRHTSLTDTYEQQCIQLAAENSTIRKAIQRLEKLLNDAESGDAQMM